jgi:hypothetical protein
VRAAGLAAALALAGSAASAQMIGADLAEVIEALGCEAPEATIHERFMAKGFHISDYQAQATSLMRGGYLVAGSGEGTWRLVGWGSCS